MAQYDGSIKIDTNITTKDAEKSLKSLEQQIRGSAQYISELRTKMDALKGQKIPTQEFKNLQAQLGTAAKEMEKMLAQDSKLADIDVKIKNLSQSVAEYAAKMKEVAAQKIPTKAYADIQKQIDSTEKKLLSLYDRQERFLATGGEKDSSVYKRMVYDAKIFWRKVTIRRAGGEKSGKCRKGIHTRQQHGTI